MYSGKVLCILPTRAVQVISWWCGKKLGECRERAFEITKITIKTLHFNKRDGWSEQRYGHSIL